MPIVDKLKEALKPGRKDTSEEADLNKLLASSAKKVLLQKIEFEPASKGFSYQLDSLKTKYVILNPRNEAAAGQRSAESTQIKRQGKSLALGIRAEPYGKTVLFFGDYFDCDWDSLLVGGNDHFCITLIFTDETIRNHDGTFVVVCIKQMFSYIWRKTFVCCSAAL